MYSHHSSEPRELLPLSQVFDRDDERPPLPHDPFVSSAISDADFAFGDASLEDKEASKPLPDFEEMFPRLTSTSAGIGNAQSTGAGFAMLNNQSSLQSSFIHQ